MPRPRRRDQLRDPSGVYHIKTRCTRGLHLLETAESVADSGEVVRVEPKRLVVDQLERLTSTTAIHVGAYAVMGNHLHLLVKLDAAAARGWTDQEVARRWFAIHPPRKVAGATDAYAAGFAANPQWVAAHRAKLAGFSRGGKHHEVSLRPFAAKHGWQYLKGRGGGGCLILKLE